MNLAYPFDIDVAPDGLTITFPDFPEAVTSVVLDELPDLTDTVRDCLDEAIMRLWKDEQKVRYPSYHSGCLFISPSKEVFDEIIAYVK